MLNSHCQPIEPLAKLNDKKANRSGFKNTIYAVNGDQYTGEWQNNKKHGRGQCIWKATQLIYEGDWENNRRCGLGMLSVIGPDGAHTKIYSGSWKDDKRNGYGENWYCDEEFYEGEWKLDKRNGWGRQYYFDGSMYEGEWLDDKRCGDGMLRLSNENRYEGQWLNDKKNGKGKYIFHATKQIMEGVWVDNIARCCHIVDLGSRMEPTKHTYPLPKIQLKDPAKVIREAQEINLALIRENTALKY